ncbi:MAG: GntR family transcriptional regulator [Chloroflexota bacterium]
MAKPYENSESEIVHYTSINEQVYTILKKRIIERRFPAGAKLDINALADELGISRMPVVEALTRLETEDLVERRNRVGTFVTPLDRTRYEEIYATREMIEQWAAQAIVARITDQNIAELWHVLEQTRHLLENVTEDIFDYQRYSEYDGMFHLSLIKLCGNSYIMNFYASMNSHVQIVRVLSLEALKRSQETQIEHEDILRTYERRDVEEVRMAQSIHLEKSRIGVLKTLELHKNI